jgi:pimeloyl-ACP methyl ester carboxylesterase
MKGSCVLPRSLPVVLVALVLAAPARAVPPPPFSHACSPQGDVRFCPTANDGQRVSSFDGTPLDVDVTLPGTGDGPFPTLVLLHGFTLAKSEFENPDANGAGEKQRYNNVYFAEHGYAVVTPSFRGFGRSCGAADSRTPDCGNGFIHLADQRYEARDIQTLLGLLVDERIADPNALGVSGVSYGGGVSMILAFLKDRVRLADGSYAPWTSPNGTPLHIAAAAPIIPWSDLSAALLPNGRYRDNAAPAPSGGRSPVGVPLKSWLDLLFQGAQGVGFVAPPGNVSDADLAGWKARIDRGEPYGSDVSAILQHLTAYHSALGVTLPRGGPAPMLISSGWTDDLFPTDQALRVYRLLHGQTNLFLGNFGHSRGANKPATLAARNEFIDRFIFCSGVRPPGDTACVGQQPVTAGITRCPSSVPDAAEVGALDYDQLHPGQVLVRGAGTATIRSNRRDAAADKAFNPVGGTSDACRSIRTPRRGLPVYLVGSRGVTLLGAPAVAARVRVTGANGELVARLFDENPRTRTERLVSRGVYRLTRNQKGSIVFQLHGAGYAFPKGHVIKLELSGSDSPYYRKSNSRFTISISRVRLQVPTLDRPSRAKGVVKYATLRAV